MKRKDFETGIILGLSLPPVPQIPREPIAYSYNGTILPKLPEWDRSVYPFAVLTKRSMLSQTEWKVSIYREMFAIHDANHGVDAFSLLVAGDDYLTATLGYTATEWPALSTTSFTGNNTADNDGTDVSYKQRLCDYDSDYVRWSNHSFNGPNGEEWIVASDPVPVYE